MRSAAVVHWPLPMGRAPRPRRSEGLFLAPFRGLWPSVRRRWDPRALSLAVVGCSAPCSDGRRAQIGLAQLSWGPGPMLSLIHISEPTRLALI
eukprot:11372746-Alexandrium_andersonii.AAC.1